MPASKYDGEKRLAVKVVKELGFCSRLLERFWRTGHSMGTGIVLLRLYGT